MALGGKDVRRNTEFVHPTDFIHLFNITGVCVLTGISMLVIDSFDKRHVAYFSAVVCVCWSLPLGHMPFSFDSLHRRGLVAS
jgi:hypothetical protein